MIFSKKQLIIISTTCWLFLTGLPKLKAEIAEFETTEYKAMNGWFRSHEYYDPLDLINAAEAYNAGYTGKGIIVGVYDFPLKPEHPEFIKKTDSKRLKNKLHYKTPHNKVYKSCIRYGRKLFVICREAIYSAFANFETAAMNVVIRDV